MSELMARVLTDQPLRDRLTARGRERLAAYNWHASAAQLVAACQRVYERSAVSAAEALRPLDRLSQLVQGRGEECAARLEVIRGLEAALRRAEADCANRLEVMQQLQAQCAERLSLVQRLDAEAAARLEACQRLTAALECSRAECATLNVGREQARTEGEALRAEAQRRGAALLQAEARCQALEAEVRRLDAVLQRSLLTRSLRACKWLVREALRSLRRPVGRGEVA
jgi:hypothetical protein